MKVQAEIISAILVVVLAMTFFGVAFTWLRPWIERKQAEVKVERLLADFDPKNPNSLPKKIELVEKIGIESLFKISSDGIWRLFPSDYPSPENNSLEFYTFSRAITAKIPIGEWRRIIKDITSTTCLPEKGKLGELPYEVCVRADPSGDGFNLTFRLVSRELEEKKIEFVKWTELSPTSSTSRSIKIARGKIYSQLVNGKKLIITQVKFLLG